MRVRSRQIARDKMAGIKTYNKWETILLYKRYQAVEKLPERDNKKLIDGLVSIIQECYENSLEPNKIHNLTKQFTKR